MASQRVEISFLDNEKRRKRVCRSSNEVEPFLRRILELADQHAEDGSYVHVAMDLETDVVNYDTPRRKKVVGLDGKAKTGDEFYHHRRLLENRGMSSEEIRQRSLIQQQISKKWRSKNAVEKARDFTAVQKQRIREGLLVSNAHTIQMAVAEDDDDKCAFIFQATTMIKQEGDGKPQLPAMFDQVFFPQGYCVRQRRPTRRHSKCSQ